MNLFQNDGWNGPGSAVSFSLRRQQQQQRHPPADGNVVHNNDPGQSSYGASISTPGRRRSEEAGYPAPPRDWPYGGGDDGDDDEENGGGEGRPKWEPAPPPPLSVCQDFVYESPPPTEEPPVAAPAAAFPIAGSESTAGEEMDAMEYANPKTLSGFDYEEQEEQEEEEEEEEEREEQEGNIETEGEESIVSRIMSEMDRGYESPYFSAPDRSDRRRDTIEQQHDELEGVGGSMRKRRRVESAHQREEDSAIDPELDRLRSLRQVADDQQQQQLPGEGFQISTDCCRQADGSILYDPTVRDVVSGDQARFWCFGCQWEAHNYRPVDNEKIADLVSCFMNLILNGSTTLENTARLVSDMYRRTIREPARIQGQNLPDWPPAVVQRHIENMTEPRIVNMLMLRKNMAVLGRVFSEIVRYDTRSGREEINIQACNMWCRLLRENREMYRQIPKESFGYNQHFRAESWNGSTLVHPTRVRKSSSSGGGGGGGGGATGDDGRGGDIRKYVTGSGVVDTGAPRGPGNDEELVCRPVGATMSAESGDGF